ncbi:MAG: hypothetical protein GEV05_12470 [Betaproteobacteria bacterium]|nr:hypothetical protein [Betaproteobacteria bacterium]
MSKLSNYLERGEQVDGWLVNFSARFIDVARIQLAASYTCSLGEIGGSAFHAGRLFWCCTSQRNPTKRSLRSVTSTVNIPKLDAAPSGAYADYYKRKTEDFEPNFHCWARCTRAVEVVSVDVDEASLDPLYRLTKTETHHVVPLKIQSEKLDESIVVEDDEHGTSTTSSLCRCCKGTLLVSRDSRFTPGLAKDHPLV